MKFIDGIQSLFSNLTNRRNALASNAVAQQPRLDDSAARAIYKTGIGSKIVRLKAGYSLDDTIQFERTHDMEEFNTYLAPTFKDAAKYMVGFGRGIIVIMPEGTDDLSKPMPLKAKLDIKTTRLKAFSGDMVSVTSYDTNLLSNRFLKPNVYSVRGESIHHTRVLDVTYVKPSDHELPEYKYGGMSEFEIILPQLIADSVVQRATPSILEKSSTLFYKISGFKETIAQGRESEILSYFGTLEDARNIYGAGVIDSEDDVEVVQQNLSNLSETDNITLRRLAMVTGIPLAILIGENVKGLNSTGDNEMRVFQDTIETLQSDYLLEPLQKLCRLFGIDGVQFKDNQGETPLNRIEYESKVIDNAVKLYSMQQDHALYLEEKGVIPKDDFASMFDDIDHDKETDKGDEDGEV